MIEPIAMLSYFNAKHYFSKICQLFDKLFEFLTTVTVWFGEIELFLCHAFNINFHDIAYIEAADCGIN